ncbi:MAG TPA: response regulator [Marinobacterium sp.]|nr:response regulator [Marinobacterium sp.]
MEKRTLLCIDDDSFTLAHLKDSLGDYYNLIFAIDPDVGFELAIKKQPDLILLDLNMPNMNGFELADMTSKLSMTKNIPVVFLSSFATDEIKERARSLGAAAFLSKPVDPGHLAATIETVFESRAEAKG